MTTSNSVTGLVFNIQKFSLHDGAGIRTLVFLKGCPLACLWCANPEGQSPAAELALSLRRCIGTKECGRCLEACDQRAIRAAPEGGLSIDRDACVLCGRCVDACPCGALELMGRPMTVEEVVRAVEEDGSFYARSGGGLTLSGGEPLLQIAFVERLLATARGRGIDTALETSGLCRWEDLEAACRSLDHLFYDIKILDTAKHREGTGVGNERILENLERLCSMRTHLPVTVRTPVIPRFNDAPADIQAVAAFVSRLPGPVSYELLPYHGFGEPKYGHLGKTYPLRGASPPARERMAALQALVPERLRPTGR
ncbi:MAG: glycyl-radical enzyme activating protein [bacterium]